MPKSTFYEMTNRCYPNRMKNPELITQRYEKNRKGVKAWIVNKFEWRGSYYKGVAEKSEDYKKLIEKYSKGIGDIL